MSDQLITEIDRERQARELLEHPLLAEALDTYEREITETWKTSPLRDAEGREKLHQMLTAATRFRAFLTQTIQTGQMARIQLERERTKWDRLNPWSKAA